MTQETETLVPQDMRDEALIEEIAQRAFARSKNLATTAVEWDELSENDRRRVSEVVVDMLGAMQELGLQVVMVQTETERRAETMRMLVERDG